MWALLLSVFLCWCAYVYFSALINVCTRLKYIGRANAENTPLYQMRCVFLSQITSYTIYTASYFGLKNTINIFSDVFHCFFFSGTQQAHIFEFTSYWMPYNCLHGIIKMHKLCIWICVFSALVNRAEESRPLLCRCALCICLTFMCRLPSQCVLNQEILCFVIIVVIAVSFSIYICSFLSCY